jgi:thiol-disulfide isomerase/thioredoxin
MAFWNQTLQLGPLALPLLFLLGFGTYGLFALLTLDLPKAKRRELTNLFSVGLMGGYLLSRIVLIIGSFSTIISNPLLLLMNIGAPWAWGLGLILTAFLSLFLAKDPVDWKPQGLMLGVKAAIALGLGGAVFFSLPFLFPEPESRSLPPIATLQGDEYRLEDSPSETLVLNFWASWCGPCEIEIPEIKAYLSQNPGDRPRFLGVNATTTEKSLEDVTDFVDRLGIGFPILLDKKGAWQEVYGVQSLPTSLLINRRGQVLNRKVGILDQNTLSAWMNTQGEPGGAEDLGMPRPEERDL